jgi:hypothetical protein
MPLSPGLVLIAVVAAAIVLDVLFLRLVRKNWARKALTPDAPGLAPVYWLGTNSPVLTWLRAQRLLALRSSSEAAAVETTDALDLPQLPGTRERARSPVEWSAALNRWIKDQLNPAALRRAWSNVLRRPGETVPEVGVRVTLRSAFLELSLILLVVLGYCSGFLQFGADVALRGNEAEVFQVNSWLLVNSVQNGVFPLWNPYLRTGVPYAGDPMLHIYNPLTSVPVLLLGVVDGFRVALFLSFVAAGWGMWYLGKTLGLAWPARVWMALMFAMAGQPVAKFLQGHYLFVFGFAWIPWAFAGLLAVLQSRRRRHAALTIAAMALLFFSGNVYYAFYMVGLLILLAPVLVVAWSPAPRVDWLRVRVLALIGVVALALIAIQFLPLAEFWPRLGKATNPLLSDSHTLSQIILDFTSTETARADTVAVLTPEEYYAYSGWWPFLALALLPLAAWKRERWPLAVFGLLLVAVFLWIDLRDMPWRELYQSVPLLIKFRYPTRLLIYGAFALLVLGGLGLDTAWRLVWPAARGLWASVVGRTAVSPPASVGASLAQRVAPITALVGAAVLLLFMGRAVTDVYTVNRPLASLRNEVPWPHAIAAWLRQHDPSLYYVGDYSDWHKAWVSQQMRYLPAWLYYNDIRRLAGMENQRPVEARPAYWVLGNWTLDDGGSPNADFGADPTLVQAFEDFSVFHLPHSLPFAFVASRDALAVQDQGELRRDDVVAQTAFVANPNRIELIADSGGGEMLVALSTHYPGWRVTIDGRAVPLRSIGGYLAAETLPGTHQYVFEYRPTSFYAGLVLSLLGLLVTAYLLVTDWPLRLADLRAGLRGAALRAPGAPTHGRWALPSQATWEIAGWRLQLSRVSGQPVALAAGLGTLLFVLSLGVYAVTRLWALDRFPIYFFGDETINVLYAEQLLRNGFRDHLGRLLPLYWEADGLRWTPLLSVYVHLLALSVFGKSLFITRATSVVVSLLGTAAVGLLLREVFKLRFWWVGVLLLTLTPAWFLHSRTAFETVMMSSFYACFLLCYLLYRTRGTPRYLYAALVFGAMAFYTYSNGQSLVAVTAALLLLSDGRYLWQQRATVGRGLLLATVLALPFILFLVQHSTAFSDHLRRIDSYLYQDLPLAEKTTQVLKAYLFALSPQYLFAASPPDLNRHVMLGYGHLGLASLPLVVVGVVLCARHWRSSPHRAVLISVLAAPVGVALAGTGITRVLSLSISAAVLGALALDLGLSWLTARLARRPALASAAPGFVSLAAFALLAAASLLMLRDAVVNGPLWYRDYGLYGMQYGAQQLFEEAVPDELAADPQLRVMVTSSWANGADRFAQFFLTPADQQRVFLRSIDYYLFEQRDLTNTLLVLTSAEYERALTSGKFKVLVIEQVLPYPDGTPGFYFIRPAYVDNAAEIFAAEAEARRQPVEATIELAGELVTVVHSRFNAGGLDDLFDGDRFSLVRGLEANPLVIELRYPAPRVFGALALDLGSMESFSVTVTLAPAGGGEPLVYGGVYNGVGNDPHITLPFGEVAAATPVSTVRVEIKNLLAGDTAQIHIRELALTGE